MEALESDGSLRTDFMMARSNKYVLQQGAGYTTTTDSAVLMNSAVRGDIAEKREICRIASRRLLFNTVAHGQQTFHRRTRLVGDEGSVPLFRGTPVHDRVGVAEVVG